MDFFKRNYEPVRLASQTGRGFSLWLEILIFFAVFLAAGFLESGLLLVVMAVVLFCSPAAVSILMSGDLSDPAEMIAALREALPGGITLLSLYATAVVSLCCILYCRFLEKRSLQSMGFFRKHAVSDYGKGLLTGLVMFGAVVLIGTLFGVFRFNGFSGNFSAGTVAAFFVGYLFQGMSEEILCRGYLMISASRKNPLAAAVIANSLIFAFLHAFNPGLSPLAVVNLFLFGFFTSVYMLKKGNIWGVAAIHSVWNFAQGNLFGMSVSGTASAPSVWVFESAGKPFLDGGAFGPEGGLCVTVVLAAAIFWVFFSSARQNGREKDPVL